MTEPKISAKVPQAVTHELTEKNDLPAISSNLTQRNDLIEIKYTGYANGEVFDSNMEEDLKKINPKAKPEKLIVVVGKGMVVSGLDKALENKELNKEYDVSFSHKEGFGERRRDLLKVIPLKSFTEQKVSPRPGMVLTLDNQLVKILAVSGARVTVDFNNPLAGKELNYKFTVVRKVIDENEKAEAVLKFLFGFIPEFEVKDRKTVVKMPKQVEMMIELYKPQFRELSGMELVFEEKKIDEKREHEHSHDGHEHHEHAHVHDEHQHTEK